MDDMIATYDPADNKLRLKSGGRLPRDIYERVHGAGFIWAPNRNAISNPLARMLQRLRMMREETRRRRSAP